MAATPPPQANQAAPPAGGITNPDPGAPAMPPPPPGTDMTGICFRDPLWLSSYLLSSELVFDYFALSPFYDWTCNNEQLRSRSVHPLDLSHLSKMTGNEYVLTEAREPHLYVIKKQKREGPEKVTPMLTYYVLDGSIYQAPQVCTVLASRISRCIHHISEAFKIASSKLEKIGHVDVEDEGATAETKTKETIDFRELKRVDHILGSLQRKLPPAPPPPAFPDGYTPPASDADKAPEDQQASEAQVPPVDPILEQGPSKRMKYQ